MGDWRDWSSGEKGENGWELNLSGIGLLGDNITAALNERGVWIVTLLVHDGIEREIMDSVRWERVVECGFLMDMDNYECVFHSSFGWIVRAGSRTVRLFATWVVREKSNVGRKCAHLTDHSVHRHMKHTDEASGGVLRECDSQGMEFKTHSSRNLWSRWEWNEWNLFWSGKGDGGWLTEYYVGYEYRSDSLGERKHEIHVECICLGQ